LNPHNGNLVFHNHLKSKEKRKLDPLLGTFDLTRKVKAESVEYFKSIKLSPAALAQPAPGPEASSPGGWGGCSPSPGGGGGCSCPDGRGRACCCPGGGGGACCCPVGGGGACCCLDFNAGVARRRSGRRSQATQSVLAAQAQGRKGLATDRSACPPLYSM
jgi:hypothetical protein